MRSTKVQQHENTIGDDLQGSRANRSYRKFDPNQGRRAEKICDALISCRVVIESPHEHEQSGSFYRICISMRVPPAHDLVVKRTSPDRYFHKTLPAVVAGGFDAAYRQKFDPKRLNQGTRL